MSNSGLPRWLTFPVDHPWIAIALSLVGIVAVAAGVAQLRFSDDIRVFFDKSDPQLQAFESHEATYSKATSILLVVSARDGDIFTRNALASLEELTNEAWKIPHSRRVDSITNFQHTYAQDDDLVVGDLVKGADSLSDDDLARIRRVALSEPLLVNRLVSESGAVAGINVPMVLPGIDPLKEQPEAVAAARGLAANIEQANPNLEVQLTGLIMMNNALAEAGYHDVQTLIPLMFVVILVVLGVMLRNITGVSITFVVIVSSIAGGLGGAGWLGIVMSPPVLSAANIIMTLAVADSVHVLVTFLHEMRHGKGKREAMSESLRVNVMPVFLTSITTMLGFLTMNFSESPPFRDLGNIVAIGVLFAFLLSIFMLPALAMVLPVRAKQKGEAEDAGMARLADFVIRRRKGLLVGVTGIVIVLTLFIPRNELNDEFVKYFDEEIAFRRATDFTIENLTGFEFIEYSLDAGEEGGIYDPAYLKRVDDFAAWYRRQPEVVHVTVFTDILKRLNKNLHGDDPEWYRLPEDRESAAQYMLLFEMSLPFGLDLTDQINIDKSATRFKVSLREITSNGMLDLETRAERWLKERAPEMSRAGTSQSLMFAHIGQRNIRSMLGGTVIALILISLMLIFAFRSVKFGLLSLVPNLAPAAMAFGLWGLLVGEVGLALSVVVGMTMGIVVDDTVHFMSKYLHARRHHDYVPEQAVRYAFDHVGKALWVTSVVLVAGFSVLMFSSFELNSGMGLLSAVTIAMALITDFLLLPPLILALEKKRNEKQASQSSLA